MVDFKKLSHAERVKQPIKVILPNVALNIIEREIMTLKNPDDAMARLLVMEHAALDTIDDGAVCELCPDYRAGSVEVVEVVREAKRKIADKMGLTLAQREKLDM